MSSTKQHVCLVVLPNNVLISNRIYQGILKFAANDHKIHFQSFIFDEMAALKLLPKDFDSAIIWTGANHTYFQEIFRGGRIFVNCRKQMEQERNVVTSCLDETKLRESLAYEIACQERKQAYFVHSSNNILSNCFEFFSCLRSELAKQEICVEDMELVSTQQFESFQLAMLQHKVELGFFMEEMEFPATCCVDNPYTATLISEIAEASGINVPRDLSLIVFGNASDCQNMTSEATIFDFPAEAIGFGAATLIAKQRLGLAVTNTFHEAIRITKPSTSPLENNCVVKAATDLIESLPIGEVNVHTVCSLLGVSRSAFQKVFKRKMGETPGDFISKRKLSQAIWLLQNTSASISEIASQLGFANTPSFSRFFFDRQGVRPSEFKRF